MKTHPLDLVPKNDRIINRASDISPPHDALSPFLYTPLRFSVFLRPSRVRPRGRPHLLHLRRGPVLADAGGPGHAGEAGGHAGSVCGSAVPHGRRENGRNQGGI